jgi:TRAP-type C4-dicarboxylate transport system permease small subunit
LEFSDIGARRLGPCFETPGGILPDDRFVMDGKVMPKESAAEAKRPETTLGRISDAISTVAGVTAGVAVIAILVIVCAEVVLRQLNRSMLVTDEIAGYLNAAVVFLGLAYTLKNGGFIRVELLYDALPHQLRQCAKWFFTAISAGVVGILLYFCVMHVQYAFQQDTRAISVLETPEWIPQAVMVLGLAVLLLQIIAFLAERIRNVP